MMKMSKALKVPQHVKPVNLHFASSKLAMLQILVLMLSVTLTLAGCSNQMTTSLNKEDRYWPEATWKTATPESQGMDSKLINDLFETISTRGIEMHHVLVVKNGYKVAEANYYPYAATDQQIVKSVTKSVTSAAIGKALDEGLIDAVEQPLLSFFKDRSYENPSDYKNQLQLKHLLAMTAGMDWSEDGNYGADYDSNTLMWRSDNQIQYMLDRPVIETPGTHFYYSTGASHLLSGIVSQVTKKSTSDYVKEKIFNPIGITQFTWAADKQGNSVGGSRLFMTAEDLARFGYLYLNLGQWQDQQLLSKAWVQASTQKQVDTPDGLAGKYGYGYQWWINPYGGYSARGYGGQYLFVLPEQNLVVVFMGSMGSTFFVPESLVGEYLIPAVAKEQTLPENKDQYEQLNQTLARLASAPEKKEIPALPARTAEWTGKTYTLENEETIQIDFDPKAAEAQLHWFTDGVLYEVPVGLDNHYRLSDCPDFYTRGKISRVGFRGTFTSDDTFVIDVCPTDGDATYTLTLTYADGQLEKTFISNLTGR